jgi:phosphotransferase system HPr (HPr) family protein
MEIFIRHELGLHARPAALFVQEAQKFSSDLKLGFNGQVANAKSMLGVLGLGVGSGARVVIYAEGKDETIAIETLKHLVESNFGE